MENEEDFLLEEKELSAEISHGHPLDVVDDLFSFLRLTKDAWKLPGKDVPPAFRALSLGGTTARIASLILLNGSATVLLIYLAIGSNPYIPLSDSMRRLDFSLLWIFLIFVSFLAQTCGQFFCFRLLSGKGNLVAHAYLSVLPTVGMTIVVGLSYIILILTQIRGIENWLLIIGGLYLFIGWFLSVMAVHELSIMRTIIAVGLTILTTIILAIPYQLLFSFLQTWYPRRIEIWHIVTVFSGLTIVATVLLWYMIKQERAIGNYSDLTPS